MCVMIGVKKKVGWFNEYLYFVCILFICIMCVYID